MALWIRAGSLRRGVEGGEGQRVARGSPEGRQRVERVVDAGSRGERQGERGWLPDPPEEIGISARWQARKWPMWELGGDRKARQALRYAARGRPIQGRTVASGHAGAGHWSRTRHPLQSSEFFPALALVPLPLVGLHPAVPKPTSTNTNPGSQHLYFDVLDRTFARQRHRRIAAPNHTALLGSALVLFARSAARPGPHLDMCMAWVMHQTLT